MEITDRKENPLLKRVELEFRISHKGSATPTRVEILNQITSMEPGADRDLVVIKNVSTRYGIATTTGLGLVYEDAESMKVEPEYIYKRFAGLRTASASEESTDGGEA
ncbi:MAG: 30S ribosomal protein S24e [Candidatus Poseidoniales archaeon]|mgnify:CR=1 FL=1|jgi:small subunit ribosomal protein S24e